MTATLSQPQSRNFLSGIAVRVTGLRSRGRFVLATLAGAAGALSMAPFQLPAFLVVSLLMLIWSIDGLYLESARDKGRRAPAMWTAALLGWGYGFGFYLAGLYWIGFAFLVEAESFAWMIPFVAVLMPGGLAIFIAVAVVFAFRLWSPGLARILILAAALAVTEWLRGHILTGFPWNLFGYAAGFSDALMQNAAIIGTYGLSLLVLIVFSSPAAFAAPALQSARPWAVMASAVLCLCLFWLWGALRLPDAPSELVDGVRLRLVQPSLEQAEKWRPENRRRNFDLYLALTGKDGFDRITHVIWPESAVPYILNREPLRVAEIGDVLGPQRSLLAGSVRIESGGPDQDLSYFNSLHVIGFEPDSDAAPPEILATYDKVHLVPFGEYLPAAGILEALGIKQLVFGEGGYSAGDRLTTLEVAGAPPFVPLICYEIIFPGHVLPSGTDARWIVNVTNDAWFGDTSGPRQHLAMTRFRAIETGLPIVRSANNGISAVIDPYGRVLSRLALNQRGVLDSGLPVAASPPLYTSVGDSIFGILVLISCISGLYIASMARKRPS